jgi:hypothetical protein
MSKRRDPRLFLVGDEGRERNGGKFHLFGRHFHELRDRDPDRVRYRSIRKGQATKCSGGEQNRWLLVERRISNIGVHQVLRDEFESHSARRGNPHER